MQERPAAYPPLHPLLSQYYEVAGMATGWPPSRLLALPQELRTKIYEELLCPEPAKVHTLWHDRGGRQGPFDLHPSILRVNKQIYFEASSFHYDNNIFEIDLTTNVIQDLGHNYPDGRPDPPPLFRVDGVNAAPRSDELFTVNTQLPIEKAQGVIYAHSFQRLRHIELRTKRTAMWGYTSGNPTGRVYFSHTGQLIMRILQLLSDPQFVTTPTETTFDFIVMPYFLTHGGIFGLGRGDARDVAIVIELLQSLGEIKKTRSVLVEESIRPDDEGDYRPLKKVKVDVNTRLAQFQELAIGRS